MEIKPTYITFEQAKLLKQKGFDIVCYKQWGKNSQSDLEYTLSKDICSHNWNEYKVVYSAPEQWQVIEWLRVKHKINVEANYLSNIGKYRWLAKPMNIIPKSFKTAKEYAIAVNNYYGKDNFNSPQEAYSAAFDYILNNLL